MQRRQNFASSLNCVGIVCDKPVYYSGDVVQGYVMLNVYSPFAARSLNVEVIGFESTNWVESVASMDMGMPAFDDPICRHPRHARRDFFEVNVPLYTFGSTRLLAPGQYQFPFRVKLPVNLPSSFLYEDSYRVRGERAYEDVVGKVRYKVTAGVVRGPTPNGICTELYDSHEIHVRQRLVRPLAELVAEHVTDVDCCCFRQGMVVVRLRADNDAYAAGDTAQVVLEVENHTSLGFPDVWVEVDRVVNLASHHSHYHHADRMMRQRFPGLGKGESRMGDQALRLALQLSPALVPTTLASLVKCSYRVWVELTPAGAFTTPPRLCVPLTVYAAQPKQVPYVAPPPESWNPQMVAPAVDVALPSAPPLDAPLPPPTAPPLPPNAFPAAPPPATTSGKVCGACPPAQAVPPPAAAAYPVSAKAANAGAATADTAAATPNPVYRGLP